MLTEVDDPDYHWKMVLCNGDREDFTGNSVDVMSPSFSLSSAKDKTAATLFKPDYYGFINPGNEMWVMYWAKNPDQLRYWLMTTGT